MIVSPENSALSGRPATSASSSVCVEKPHNSPSTGSLTRITHNFSARSASKFAEQGGEYRRFVVRDERQGGGQAGERLSRRRQTGHAAQPLPDVVQRPQPAHPAAVAMHHALPVRVLIPAGDESDEPPALL